MRNLKAFEEYFKDGVEEDWFKYNPPTDFEHTFESFMKANGVDDNTVTEDMMDWYAYQICHKDSCNDIRQNYGDILRLNSHVDEMLNKTSIDFLVKQLNMGLADGDNHISNKTDNENVNELWVSEKIYNVEKIMKICDKCMWSFSAVQTKNGIGVVWGNPMMCEPYVNNSDGYPVIKIHVEPVKTKNITDFVKNNCGGKIYHICPNGETLDSVMKSGLRMKGEKNIYRYINNKVYFFCGETKNDIIDALAEVAMTKYAWDTDTGWLTDDYTLLEIDVNGYNINFYQDGYYPESIKYIGYTYNYFPPKRLREVDVYELKPDYEDPNW